MFVYHCQCITPSVDHRMEDIQQCKENLKQGEGFSEKQRMDR